MEEQSVYIWSGGDIIISNEHVCGFLPPTPHHHHHSTLKQIKIFSCREIFIVFLFLCQRSNFPKFIFLRKSFSKNILSTFLFVPAGCSVAVAAVALFF
jgi:hypothetical protein